jgi:hypothetical protein
LLIARLTGTDLLARVLLGGALIGKTPPNLSLEATRLRRDKAAGACLIQGK